MKKPFFGQILIFQSTGVTLKIRSSSSNLINSTPSKPYIYMCNSTTGSVNSGNAWFIQSLLKKVNMSPKSSQLFSPSKQCSHASLLKLLPLVQKIKHGNPILDISKCWCHLVNKVMVTI